jgi:hypothetical protein
MTQALLDRDGELRALTAGLRALAPEVDGFGPLPPVALSYIFGAEAHRRLREIKHRVDPDGLIVANHPV